MLSCKNLKENMLKMRYFFFKSPSSAGVFALRPSQSCPHQLYCYKTF